ncbi:hypothetical protein LX36DRAFT_727991 [Colletotrichum falcatum]|nr:hypothetical protein LX36DRAFT_727991 [Colletotrichum falcatum]
MSSDAKGSHNPSGLPTPQPSAEPEDRAKADQEKSAASPEVNVKQENGGDHESAAAAVDQHPGAPPASAEKTKENKADGAASDASARLRRVAVEIKRILDCPDASHAQILGLEPDPKPDDSNHKDAPGAYLTKSDDVTPVPPAKVQDIYNEATRELSKLREDSTNLTALKKLQNLNAKISTFNAAEKETLGADGAEISLDRWHIPMEFFAPHYNVVQERYKILDNNRTHEEARKAIAAKKQLIDGLIERDHFPAANPPADQAAIPYPWLTDKADDGSVIIGVRKQGSGYRVLTEREEDGQIIRRLEAASKVGSERVKEYCKETGCKNLAKGQSEWSDKDCDDFERLLWVTRSQTKRKNTAAGKKDILTLSSLRRVLGHGDANKKIKEVCERDGFLPPWEAGNISEFYDPSALEKDPVKRRALGDTQAASPAKNRLNQLKSLGEAIKKEDHELEQLDDRLRRLEDAVNVMTAKTANLEQSMDQMAKMFTAFMAKVMPNMEKAK